MKNMLLVFRSAPGSFPLILSTNSPRCLTAESAESPAIAGAMFLSRLGRLLLVFGDPGRPSLALNAAETGAIADVALGFRRNPGVSMGSDAVEDVGGRGRDTLLALTEEVRLALALREAGRSWEATGGLRGLARVPELFLVGAERA
jgi:hypothetical protein